MAKAGIVGVKELQKKFRALSNAASGKILAASARQAMQPMLATAKATAPVGVSLHKTYKGRLVTPGFAQRHVKLRVKTAKNKGAVWADLGVTQEAFYVLQFVELGTSRMPAQPWLVPAFRANSSNALASYRKSLRRRILNAAKKK